MITVVHAFIAGELAVVEQQDRGERLYLEGLFAARSSGDRTEVGRHLVGGVVVQRLFRDDAQGLLIHDLYVEIDFRSNGYGLFGRCNRLLAILEGEGIEQAYGHGIVDPDLTGDFGDTLARATAARKEQGQWQDETQSKENLFHITGDFCLFLLYYCKYRKIGWEIKRIFCS